MSVLNLLEEAGMFIQEKAYIASHPCLWEGYSTPVSAKEKEKEEEPEVSNTNDITSSSIRNIFSLFDTGSSITKESLNRTTTEECDSANLTVINEAVNGTLQGIDFLFDGDAGQDFKSILSRMMDPNLTDEERMAAAMECKDKEFTVDIGKLLVEVMSKEMESKIIDVETIEPGEAANVKPARARAAKTTKAAAPKGKERVNLKEAIETTPLGKKLFTQTDEGVLQS